MRKLILALTVALVAAPALADLSPAQLGNCSVVLDLAADVARQRNDTDGEDCYRQASERANTQAVARGLPGTIINDYYANATKQQINQAWANSHSIEIRSCMRAVQQIQ